MPTLSSWLMGSGTHREDTEPSYQCPRELRATSGPPAGMGVGGGGICHAHSRGAPPGHGPMGRWNQHAGLSYLGQNLECHM